MYPSQAPPPIGLTVIAVSAAGVSWAIPAVTTNILGKSSLRFVLDLSAYSQWRLVANLSAAAAAGSKLRLKYASTGGGALSNMGTAGDIAADGTGGVVGAWTTIPSDTRGPTFLAVHGLDGDGVTTAVIENLVVQFR